MTVIFRTPEKLAGRSCDRPRPWARPAAHPYVHQADLSPVSAQFPHAGNHPMRIARTALVFLAPARSASLLVAATIAAGIGCASDPTATDFKSIKNDLTPELTNIAERDVDIERNLATTSNQNLRMFWNDVGRAWYVDRPSILSPYFIIPTSGQPR